MLVKRNKNIFAKIPVIRGAVLGVNVFRGFADLSIISQISQPDIYDQTINPKGTQRDLNHSHAKNAYNYVASRNFAFWPEVFLCARNKNVVKYFPSAYCKDTGVLLISKRAINRKSIAISRVDGNHRLHYASGDYPGYPPLRKPVSFCLAMGLTRDQEITLFKDINDNQRRMDTSHLDNIKIRLTGDELLKKEDPYLYIAKKMSSDKDSPFCDIVYQGGHKSTAHIIPLRALKTGIQYMLSRTTKLTALKDPDVQLKVIKNYFLALRKWEPKAWKHYKKYLMLRGAGFWAACFLGTEIINDVLTKGKFGVEDMLSILKSGRKWDWSNNGDFKGLSGRAGAKEISEKIVSKLKNDSGVSVENLVRKIMSK